MTGKTIRETSAMQFTRELQAAGAPHAAAQACYQKLDAEAMLLMRQNELLRQQVQRSDALIKELTSSESIRRLL